MHDDQNQIDLVSTRYGKARVRVLKVTHDARKEVAEWTVKLLLKGDFDAAHIAGDNTLIVTTDTMKNTIYFLAKRSSASTSEIFALELCAHMLTTYPQVSGCQVEIASAMWKRLTIEGKPHPDTFMRGSAETQITLVDQTRAAAPMIRAGFKQMALLKTANSAFDGYVQDALTTLPESRDRVFGTEVEATWLYASTPADYQAARDLMRETMLRVFANHASESVQHTLYAMAEAALTAVPAVSELTMTMPNKHCLLIDLARFGETNANQIFVPTDEPHGYIEATVRRR